MTWELVKDKAIRLVTSRKFWAMLAAILIVLINADWVMSKPVELEVIAIIMGYAGLTALEDIGYYSKK